MVGGAVVSVRVVVGVFLVGGVVLVGLLDVGLGGTGEDVGAFAPLAEDPPAELTPP